MITLALRYIPLPAADGRLQGRIREPEPVTSCFFSAVLDQRRSESLPGRTRGPCLKSVFLFSAGAGQEAETCHRRGVRGILCEGFSSLCVHEV